MSLVIPPGWKGYTCSACGHEEASPAHEPGGWGWGKDGRLLCPPHREASLRALYAEIAAKVYVPARGPVPREARRAARAG